MGMLTPTQGVENAALRECHEVMELSLGITHLKATSASR